jgi:hypothetical protein
MRRQPLKVANASAGIAKLRVVMIDDITTRVPKNSLMTKNNTIETQRVDINNLIQDMIFLLLRTSNTLTIHSPFGN